MGRRYVGPRLHHRLALRPVCIANVRHHILLRAYQRCFASSPPFPSFSYWSLRPKSSYYQHRTSASHDPYAHLDGDRLHPMLATSQHNTLVLTMVFSPELVVKCAFIGPIVLAAHGLAASSAVYNPIIYTWAQLEFRQQAAVAFARCFRSRTRARAANGAHETTIVDRHVLIARGTELPMAGASSLLFITA
jgi:hypothetical protein